MVTFSDIEAAAGLLRPHIHRTPVLRSRTLDALAGNELLLKAENLQRIGAFKIRGAYNKIASLTDAERARGVVAHSSGNHAQGVALASRLFGIRATIVMPENSVPGKVAATKGYGAEVIFCADSTDDRERVTAELIRERGAVLIHPYNDEKLIAGQGTAALELCEDAGSLDALYVPVGGGGLIAGSAIAAKHRFPGITVIGVETEGADDCCQSFRAGRIIKIPRADTIADGMRTLSVGTLNFEIIRRFVDDVITVRDEEVLAMMRFFFERMKVVVEPTGAVAPAAALANRAGFKGKRLGAIISGGNVDPAVMARALA
jgi:threonine dehydratase